MQINKTLNSQGLLGKSHKFDYIKAPILLDRKPGASERASVTLTKAAT